MLEPFVTGDPVIPGRLQKAFLGKARHPLPEAREGAHRAVPSPEREPMRKNDGVHRAGAGRTNPVYVKPGLLEQTLQNPPGERAMGAAALQREICNLLFSHPGGGRNLAGSNCPSRISIMSGPPSSVTISPIRAYG